MKQVITVILITVCFSLKAQDSSYNAKIVFNMTDSIENSITFQRKATFEAMIYNQRVNSIALQFYVDFYNSDGTKKMKSVKGYAKEIIVSTSNYVVSATGVYVGSLHDMLVLYGTPSQDTTLPAALRYTKKPGSQFYQLSTACMTEYDYMIRQIDATNKISSVIKNIGQREAASGRLN